MGSFQSFEELACWKEARVLRNFVKDEIIPRISKSERFELISQVKRSARSIGNNIAEGFGRFHYQENIQFCRIARGSLNETLDHAIIALDEDYIQIEQLDELRKIHDKTQRILNGYFNYLKNSKFNKE